MRRWELPDPLLVHWVSNPGLAFNELALGQRLPKLSLICDACGEPPARRDYIPCPSCGSIHEARLWSGSNGFRNWRGLPCPTCHRPIPCLWNVTSRVLLILTAPIWGLPYLLFFKNRPLEFRPARAVNVSPSLIWSLAGAVFGFLMWLILGLAPIVRSWHRTGVFDTTAVVIMAVVCIIGGVLFAVLMARSLGRRRGR